MKNRQITAILLSAIMALLPCIPICSINALAAENTAALSAETAVEATESEGKQAGSVIDSGTCGDKTHWTVTGESGNYTLTISGTGSVSPGYDKAPWDKYKSQIKKAVVGEGITFLGSYTFNRCESLTDITLPKSLLNLGDGTFAGCKSLTHIDLPSGLGKLSSNREIGSVFASSGLKEITIPSGIEMIPNGTFYECNDLETVVLPENLRIIEGSAFYNTGIKKLTFPRFFNEIGNRAFYGCYDLKEMVFTGNAPYFDSNCFTSAVTAVAFYPADDSTWTEMSGKITAEILPGCQSGR